MQTSWYPEFMVVVVVVGEAMQFGLREHPGSYDNLDYEYDYDNDNDNDDIRAKSAP
jgi:hypothetical protein